MKVSKVEQIIIYPIKSLGGIRVNSALALTAGFQYDRRWMLVDGNNVFITQRELPVLSQFSTQLSKDQLIVSYQDNSFGISLDESQDGNFVSKVFDDPTIVNAVNPMVDEWFSDHLKQRVKLVKMASEESRSHYSSIRNIELNVSLADGYPYLLLGEQSFENLNNKLKEPISIRRFRANFIVSSVNPHEEDNWEVMQIGQAKFSNIKPCGRCQIITIDPTTSKINNEPLKVLNQYRKSGNNVLFGTNIMCTQEGIVSVGDLVIT